MNSLLQSGSNPRNPTVRPAEAPDLPTPPSSLRVMRLLAGVAWRRMVNQMSLGFATLSRTKAPGQQAEPRQPAPARGKNWLLILLCLYVGLHIPLGGWLLGWAAVDRLATRLDPTQAEARQASDPPTAGGDDFRLVAPWPAAPDGWTLTAAVGLFLLVLGLGQLAAMLGGAKQDLGKSEWDLAWLFTFPVPARTLFLNRLIQGASVGPFQLLFWLLWMPFLSSVYWCAGHGWWSMPLAVASTAYFSLLIASLALVVETWLQKRVAPARRKNVQAALVFAGSVLGLLAMAMLLAPTLDGFLLGAARRLPAVALANPFSLPALLCAPGWLPRAGAAAAMAALGVAVPFAAVRLAEWLVRDGLIASPGAFQGSRAPLPAPPRKFAGLFGGLVGKELLMLARDRAFLVQTLVTPVLIVAFMFLLHASAGTQMVRDAHHAASLAFGVGVYALCFSAFGVLTAEGRSLWLLFTFPRRLHAMLLQKTLLWSAFASLYALAALGIAALAGMPMDGNALAAGAVAVAGVFLFSFIAAAMGILATDPSKPVAHRRPPAAPMLLFAPLASVYLIAIYSPSAWMMVGQVVLFAMLAVALWQKVQDRLPHLLDPTASPPRKLGLADGMVAAVAFLNLQGLALALLTKFTTLPWGTRWLTAFVAAGAAVAIGAFFFLRRVPGLLGHTGLASSATEPRATIRGALGQGALAGVLAALFGVAYLFVITRFEGLRAWKESFTPPPSTDNAGLLAVLAVYVLAAPIFEEFIFRGLLYRGMRRSVGPAFAVLGSAAIFAVVHSPVAALPVFVLGVAAAVSFERSRLLLAPVVAHMVYNAVVVAAEWVL